MTFQRPWQVRACPIDFAETFIREGWRGVEAKFGFHTRTNKRCIVEAGGEELIRQRRAYMAQVRKLRRSIQHRHETVEPGQVTAPEVRAAIAFLRSRDGGSWLITATGVGDFYFGATRMDGGQIVARAVRKGFQPHQETAPIPPRAWHAWPDEDKKTLRLYWGVIPAREIQTLLPARTEQQIAAMASWLKLGNGVSASVAAASLGEASFP